MTTEVIRQATAVDVRADGGIVWPRSMSDSDHDAVTGERAVEETDPQDRRADEGGRVLVRPSTDDLLARGPGRRCSPVLARHVLGRLGLSGGEPPP